jgi:pimeloyl-ACP methyl ester carboxylesterase
MTPEDFAAKRQFVDTPFGRIAYVRMGKGPTALFIHGVPLNGYHWRKQLEDLCDIRDCIAIDVMGLGHSEVAADQDLTFPAQAEMVLSVLDALHIDVVDIVANDSGGAIAQLTAVAAPERVRSLVLTNCDVHDNWPPATFGQAVALAKSGEFEKIIEETLTNPGLAQSDFGLGIGFENKEHITPELVKAYVTPLVQNEVRRQQLNRYVALMNCEQTVSIEPQLKELQAPTLILWGTDDVFFTTEWAYWLKDTIPGATKVVEFEGARLFFSEERAEDVNSHIREHWTSLSA